MMPRNEKDDLANDWFNDILSKLRYSQDYQVYPGSSKKLYDDDGEQTGISIIREDVRLYSTGVTKLYEIVVDGKEYPVEEYTEEDEKGFEESMRGKWPELFEEQL